MKNEFKLIIFSLFFLIFFATFCFEPHAAVAQTGNPIKLGYSGMLSHPAVAAVAEQGVAAVQVAINDVNKSGGLLGRPVELIVRDNAGIPDKARRGAIEMVELDGVKALFGGNGSSNALAVSSVAREKKIIFFDGAQKTTKLLGDNYHPYVFVWCCNVVVEAKAGIKIIKKICKERGIDNPRIYYLGWDYIYSHDVFDVLKENLPKEIPKAKIVGEGWPEYGDTDFSSYLSAIRARNVDLVMAPVFSAGIISLVKQGASHGLFTAESKTKLFISAQALDDGVVFRLQKELPVGLWSNGYMTFNYPDNAGAREYLRKVKAISKQKEFVNTYAACDYFAVKFWIEGVKRAGTLDSLKIAEALQGMEMDTFLGPQRIRDFDHQVDSTWLHGPLMAIPDFPYRQVDMSKAFVVKASDYWDDYETWHKKYGHKGGLVMD
jgi:branched-chain amino acid transport system substrate-binding protein